MLGIASIGHEEPLFSARLNCNSWAKVRGGERTQIDDEPSDFSDERKTKELVIVCCGFPLHNCG